MTFIRKHGVSTPVMLVRENPKTLFGPLGEVFLSSFLINI